MKKIAIISGNVRDNSNTRKVAKWVKAQSLSESNTYDIIDLSDINLPHYNEPISPSRVKKYVNQEAQNWSDLIKQYDGYIFVIPEYNGFFPGVVKDAVDYLYHEWTDKPFGLVGIGGKGGKWACNHLRTLLERFDMVFEGFVGIKNPWNSINEDGSIDPNEIENRIQDLFTNLK